MSSTNASSSKSKDTTAAPQQKEEPKQATQPHLSALEEDDEFEEFEVQDWDNNDTDGARGGEQNLWEDNWDDDDIEDEFMIQLRGELAKVGKNGVSSDAMQH